MAPRGVKAATARSGAAATLGAVATKSRGTALPRIALLIGAAVVLGIALSGPIAWRLTARPSARFDEPAPEIAAASVEGARLMTADGLGIGAWLVDGPGARGTVVLVHGIGGSRTQMLPRIEWLVGLGLDVLAISLRAHGDSDGDVVDFGSGSAHDVVTAVERARSRWPTQGLSVHGMSLGSSAALHAAPLLGDKVETWLLESPFQSLRHAVHHRVARQLPSAAVPLAVGLLDLWARPRLGHDLAAVDLVAAARGAPPTEPFWVLAGEADTSAPIDEVRHVADALPGATFVVFPGLGHGELRPKNPKLYREVVEEMLGRAP